MKDIILPFTHETKNKLVTCFYWVLRIIFPILFVYGIIINDFSLIAISFIMIFAIWWLSVTSWYIDGKLPSIRFKGD